MIDPPETGPGAAAPGSVCLNCASTLAGRFCSECGQSAATGRLSLRSTVADLASHLWNLDSTALRTARELTLRPGEACRDYVAGQRIRFVSPLRYCLTLVAISFLVSTVLGFRPPELGGAGGSPTLQAVRKEVADMAWRHADLAIFAALPLFSVVVWLAFGRRRTTYAETTAFVLFVMGHLFLLSLPLVPLKLVSAGLYIAARLGLQTVFFSWAAVTFYRAPRFSGTVRGVLATLAYYVLMAVMVALFSLPSVLSALRS